MTELASEDCADSVGLKSCSGSVEIHLFKLDKYEKLLILIFLATLPLSNPWVRGDGVGYYAYVRSLLIERNLNFEEDWKHGNDSFVMGRLDSNGRVVGSEYTQTGHINNHWSIGPSILWAPFLIATHVAVLVCNLLGAHIRADGFSLPYLDNDGSGYDTLWLSRTLPFLSPCN